MPDNLQDILWYFTQRYLPPAGAIAISGPAILCLLPSAWVRPHMFVLPIMVVWMIGLILAREKGRAPPLPMALLMILWANMHGSFLLGLVLIGPFALEAIWQAEDRKRAFLQWSIFGVASVLAALVTPFGINGFIYPVQVSGMETLHNISEWHEATISNSPVFYAAVFGFLGALLLLGVRFPPLRGALFLFLLFMAFSHRRHQFVFGFLGAALAAEPIANALGKCRRAPGSSTKADRTIFAATLPVAIAVVVLRLAIPVNVDEKHKLPLDAIAQVPPTLKDQRVFNYYDFGGPLNFKGYRPFIDGRADMYGDTFFARYVQAEGGDAKAWRTIEAQYDIRWTMLPPTSRLVPVLEQGKWRRIYADKRAVIHVRDGAPAPAQLAQVVRSR
mgnify:CR=1 FL=1